MSGPKWPTRWHRPKPQGLPRIPASTPETDQLHAALVDMAGRG